MSRYLEVLSLLLQECNKYISTKVLCMGKCLIKGKCVDDIAIHESCALNDVLNKNLTEKYRFAKKCIFVRISTIESLSRTSANANPR